MLGLFRRIINSRVGIIVTFAVLILIALAFAAGDVTGLRTTSGGMSGTSVAKVGDASIGSAELTKQARDALEGARQQQPTLDMSAFIAGGGLDGTLERLINGLAMEEFGHDQGLVVGKMLVDGELAGYPSLQGPTGKFDQTIYNNVLAQRRLTDAEVRADIARDLIARHLVVPTIGASQVPEQLALPYAALLLERRSGQIAFIPTAAVAKAAPPTDAEVQTWYRANVARYSLPERRVMRYALVTPASVRVQATPSDAEIAAAYQQSRVKYQPTEKRTVTQVTILDQTAANALAAKVKGGTAIADAARATGLEPRIVTGVEKAAYATQTSSAVADVVFAAARGAVVGPVRGSIGFIVAHVDSVEQVPGRSLDQARSEIAAALTTQKIADALGRVQDALGDAIEKDANFNELTADQKLQGQVTPALTAQGVNPEDTASKPDPAFAQIVSAGFAAAEGDTPTVVQTGADGSFAVVVLDKIVPAAPRPLAQIRDAVAEDFAIDRAKKAARQVATQIVAATGKGRSLAEALAATKLKLPPVKSLDVPRAQLAANPQGAPAPLALLFSMAPKTAKMLEAPNDSGWLIVKLDTIVRGDASKRPEVVSATRADMGRVIGQEYAQEFTTAVRRAVTIKRNADALAKVKADLTGRGGSDQ